MMAFVSGVENVNDEYMSVVSGTTRYSGKQFFDLVQQWLIGSLVHFKNSPGTGIEFDVVEMYLDFKLRILNALMLIATILAAAVVMFDWTELSRLGPQPLLVTGLYCTANCVLMIVLYGQKHLHSIVSRLFITISYATFVSGLLLAVDSGSRDLWFHISVVAMYALQGRRAGDSMSAITMGGILFANEWLPVPLSVSATVQLILGLSVISLIAHACIGRASAFVEKMVATNIKLQELADKDPLTGLLNPRAYYEVANRMIRLAQRSSSSYALVFIDLDHFKAINDRFGHEVGDIVLRRVAHCLASHMRQSDVLVRIGGEEFVFFLPETTLEGAIRLGEKLRIAVERLEPTTKDGERIDITASIGIAGNHATDQSVADIQRRADRAMYKAKAAGRNRIEADTAGAMNRAEVEIQSYC